MRNTLAGLLIFAYLFALVMSTGHLAEWYRLTLGSLPGWFAVGLAAALEASAFLLSLLSNSLLRDSRWAGSGALIALALVWVGNFFSMMRAGASSQVPHYEVFLASLFVPVSTYVVAKVLGELLSLPVRNQPASSENLRGRSEVARRPAVAISEAPTKPANGKVPPEGKPAVVMTAHIDGDGVSGMKQVEPATAQPQVEQVEATTRGRKPESRPVNGESKESKDRLLEVLKQPRTVRELLDLTGMSRSGLYKALQKLQDENLAHKDGERWARSA